MENLMIFAASSGQNLELANRISQSLTAQKAKTKLVNLIDLNLPLYSTLEEKREVPSIINHLAQDMVNSDSFVFVAPEYNGGIPPSLTNFIAWMSRKPEGNWRDCFNKKRALLATHSGGGGLHCLMAMRIQLSYIGMNVLGRQIHTHFKKSIEQDSLDQICLELTQDRVPSS